MRTPPTTIRPMLVLLALLALTALAGVATP